MTLHGVLNESLNKTTRPPADKGAGDVRPSGIHPSTPSSIAHFNQETLHYQDVSRLSTKINTFRHGDNQSRLVCQQIRHFPDTLTARMKT